MKPQRNSWLRTLAILAALGLLLGTGAVVEHTLSTDDEDPAAAGERNGVSPRAPRAAGVGARAQGAAPVQASGGAAAEAYEVDSDAEVAMAVRNRRKVLTKNIADLTAAAAQAELDGNPARAQLMRRRIAALSTQLAEAEAEDDDEAPTAAEL